jgi:hypothetical protein
MTSVCSSDPIIATTHVIPSLLSSSPIVSITWSGSDVPPRCMVTWLRAVMNALEGWARFLKRFTAFITYRSIITFSPTVVTRPALRGSL